MGHVQRPPEVFWFYVDFGNDLDAALWWAGHLWGCTKARGDGNINPQVFRTPPHYLVAWTRTTAPEGWQQ